VSATPKGALVYPERPRRVAIVSIVSVFTGHPEY